MLHFELDPRSAVPAYRQLMDQVRYYLAAGALPAGERLPSIRELARYLGVNPTTVVKAYTELEHEGALERKQGKGVFARASKAGSQRAAERALRDRARRLAVEAAQLGAEPELVRRLVEEELTALDGAPPKKRKR